MTLDVKSGLQRMNDELTYPVILKIAFKKNKFEKHEKHTHEEKSLCAFISQKRFYRTRRLLPFRRAEITVGLLGLQQEFDFGMAYLSGLNRVFVCVFHST